MVEVMNEQRFTCLGCAVAGCILCILGVAWLTAAGYPQGKVSNTETSNSRIGIWKVNESGTSVPYMIVKTPIQPTYRMEHDTAGRLVPKGNPENFAYLLLRSTQDRDPAGDIIWLQYGFEPLSGRTQRIQPKPEMKWALTTSLETGKLYLTNCWSMGGHSTLRVYEIDAEANYGTYPPLSLKPELMRGPDLPVEPSAFLTISLSEGGQSVSGITGFAIGDKNGKLIVSFKGMFLSGRVASFVYSVDPLTKRWSRSVK